MNNRWVALAIISASFLQCTLNWFSIVPAFGELMTEMSLGYPQLGLLVGMFVAGYGIAHIPAGMISEAFGMRFALLAGIAVLTLGTVFSAKAANYELLLLARFVSGVGASIYVGSALGLTAAWFRGRELGTAYGVLAGLAFTLGAWLGLYVWIDLVAEFGWRDALMLAALVAGVTFVAMLVLFPTPRGHSESGVESRNLNIQSLKRVFGNRNLWIMGASFMGGYGSYLTAAQLLPQYAAEQLHLEAHDASLLGTVLLASGVVGGPLGGWLADRAFGVVPTFVAACVVHSAALLLVPHLAMGGLTVAAAVIGASHIMAFSAWISVPGSYRDDIEISDIPTACGLMLTLSAIGGFVVPVIYGWFMASVGHQSAWVALAAVSLATMFACFFATTRRLEASQGQAAADA
jgi:predicted MFS family arabinose efflux permease